MLRRRDIHLQAGHLFQVFVQFHLPVADKRLVGLDGLMNLDEPPVRIGIVTPRRQPDHPQAIGKADQADDGGFIGGARTTVNELLRLVCLDG